MKSRSTWKAYAITLLCILTAATSALSSATMCKYYGMGAVTASVRAAKWHHTYSNLYLNDGVGVCYGYLPNSVANDFYKYPTFSVTNNSEVAAYYTLYVYGYDTDPISNTLREVRGPNMDGTAHASGNDSNITSLVGPDTTGAGTFELVSSSGTPAPVKQTDEYNKWLVGPGVTCNFRVVLRQFYSAGRSSYIQRTYRCRVFVRAVQLD